MRAQLTRLALVAPIAFAVAACQPSAGPPTPGTPTDAPAPEVAEPSRSDIGSTAPDWITRPALTCGDPHPLFAPEALEGPGVAEFGLDPAAAVLRSTIADTPDYFPDSGWHRVAETPGEVLFVARGNAETPWFEVTVGWFDGVPQAIAMGQCTLAIAPPDGVSLASWWLDPAGPPIGQGTTELAVLIRERDCASGKPPEGRVLAPSIVTSADRFEIAIGIRKQLTDQDCQGNPAHPMRLALPEPIGDRVLFDASAYPPRLVTTDDPG